MAVLALAALAAPASTSPSCSRNLGKWNCPTGVLTITEKMHSVARSQSPITRIVRKSATVHHVFLGPDEIRLTVKGRQLHWSQIGMNEDMDCKR